MKKLLITFLLLATPCFAQEEGLDYVPRLDEQGNVLLNEQLRRTARRLRALEGGIPASDITGVVQLNQGGTGSELSDPGADRIIFWDDSDSAVEFLEAGTDLAITGNSLDWSGTHPTPGLDLVSTTTGDKECTDDITIEADKQYYITFEFRPGTGMSNAAIVEFDIDPSGSEGAGAHSWVREETDINGSTGSNITSGGGDVDLSNKNFTIDSFLKGFMYLSTYDGSGEINAYFNMEFIFQNEQSSDGSTKDIVVTTLRGFYDGGVVDHFSFDIGTCTGSDTANIHTIKLYEYE